MSYKNLLLCLTAAFAFAVRGEIGVSGDTTGATDTAAIQSALDAAKTGGGTVTLGGGVFYIDATIALANGVTLTGLGRDKTVLKAAAGANIRCVQLAGGSKLEHLTVTGGKQMTGWAHGAGVYVDNGSVSWCCISNNAIQASNSFGAGVFFKKGSIDHSIVTGNSLSGSGYGAGIAAYGTTGEITIDSCLIAANRSEGGDKGGAGIGMYAGYQSYALTIRNTTIANNVADQSGATASGGAIQINASYGKTVMTDCIVAGNASKGCDGDVYFEYTNKLEIDYCFFDKSADVRGTHSVSGNPQFTNAAAGDYTLTSASPAKGAGVTYTGIGMDLAGATFANPPSMGCYEFGSGSGESGGEDDPPVVHTHTWGAPSYVWSADYKSCTASAACTGDASHTVSKTETSVYSIVQAATTAATGVGRYTANFADEPFTVQTKDVTIPKIEVVPPPVDPADAAQPSGDATGAKDTKTIQDLIDAVAPSHGSVVLGSGVFVINAQLMITNGVTLVGRGWAQTVIKAASGKSIRLVTIDGNAKLEKVTLTGGRSADGAGAAVRDGTISWCCISNNVGTSGYGGGVSFSNGRGQIDHSVVAGNSQSGTAYGAGIGMNYQTGSVTVDTCLIYGNACAFGSGGGVMAEHIGSGRAVMILNSTVTGNTTRYNAGGVHVKNGDNGTCVLINDILSGNTAGSNTPKYPDLTLENALATGSAYNLFGTQDEAVGSGYAVGAAPFVGNGDYHLSEAKELDYETDDAACVDLDNLARSGRVDVGCYEFGGTPYVERPGLTIYVD